MIHATAVHRQYISGCLSTSAVSAVHIFNVLPFVFPYGVNYCCSVEPVYEVM